MATAQRWRTAASMYEDLLRLNGLSTDDTRLIRHSIESQKYWEKEKDVLSSKLPFENTKCTSGLVQGGRICSRNVGSEYDDAFGQ
ncbi:Histone H4 [Metarhizium robertsii ARSEF 23]|uniref:Histone H4 n=1 Tax=Metarhizium robertsii (strain ARSEF 23 / ATCC MYA-3075) TaxID=655844 RepID=A0A0B2XHW3_METRA|nr:Histone H4 [Metarhizium robertsii ARSEF 23]KHO11481.1 Histone H4 [Metarhizium robertsii ARSEF 23]